MDTHLVLTLRRPFMLEVDGPHVRIDLWSATLTFPSVPRWMRVALELLARGAPSGELSSTVVEHGGDDALPVWYHHLAEIERRGGIVYELVDRERTIARAFATTPDFHSGTGVASANCRWTLSRFTFLHRPDSTLVLESAAAGTRVELLDTSLLPLIGALAAPAFAADIVRSARKFSRETARQCLGLFEYCGMITRVDQRGSPAEDSEISRGTWHLPDLLLHRRSRAAWNDAHDDTNRQVDLSQSQRAVETRAVNDAIDLHVPDLDDLSNRDPSLTSVLTSRRSIRAYGDRPITKKQLGEFLYRTSRSKQPAAGACYELETYVAVEQCEGLTAGLYHYDAWHHTLARTSGDQSETPQLLAHASAGAQLTERPQVLIVLAARFDRLMPKYGPGSYALILQDVGILLQTMYLVATAIQLAPCAVGSGDSALFSRVAGADPYDETSVGALLLGSLPA